MKKNLKLGLTLAAAASLATTGCSPKSSEEASSAPKSLYVTAGVCNSGPGVTAYNAAPATVASKAVTKWDSSTGRFIDTIIDWNVAAGFALSMPQQTVVTSDKIYILAENGTSFTERKVFSVDKDNLGVFQTKVPTINSAAPAAAATHIARNMVFEPNGSVIVNRANAIEKVNGLGAIIPGPGVAGTSYVNPLAATGTCFPNAMLTTGTVVAGGTYVGISDVDVLDPAFGRSSGKIIASVTGATAGANRLSAINPDGLASTNAAGCAGTAQISTTAHVLATNLCPAGGCPNATFDASGVSITSFVLIKTPAPATTTAKLIATYAPSNTVLAAHNNTVNLNQAIVMWNVTESADTGAAAVTFDTPVVLYKDDLVLAGSSAIAYDEATSTIYVGTGPSPRTVSQVATVQGYNVEKFTLDLAASTVERVAPNLEPFIKGNSQTKCISGLTIAD